MKEHLENQTFWDGQKRFKVARLFKLAESLKPFNIPLKHFNIHNLNPEIDSTMDFVNHMKQTLDADLSFPIILDEEGYVMDGRHRVMKALLKNKKSILAVRFLKTPDCCFVQQDEE